MTSEGTVDKHLGYVIVDDIPDINTNVVWVPIMLHGHIWWGPPLDPVPDLLDIRKN